MATIEWWALARGDDVRGETLDSVEATVGKLIGDFLHLTPGTAVLVSID